MTNLLADPVLALHRLSFAPEGDDVVVGRRDIDSYGVFPPDGAALVRELAAGRPVADAARWYEDTYGEPVDLAGFVDTLSELQFLRRPDEPTTVATPVRWQRLGRALFSPVALVLYGMVVAAAIGISLGDPSFAPRPSHVFFVESFLIVELTMVLGQLPLSGIHELAHLLAGRRLGLRSRIRLSNRFYFVVFETTLDGLVSVPRRQRFVPMLAGMGADAVVMAALTIAAVALPDGSLASRICLALAFSTLPRIVWQGYLFLQTDIYFLVATLLGCIDLHSTSRQWIANRWHRAARRPERLVDEAAWHPADRRAVRWYAPLMIAGYGAAAVMMVVVAIPLAWHLFGGALRTLLGDDGGGNGATWDAAVLFAVSGIHLTLAYVLARRERRVRAHSFGTHGPGGHRRMNVHRFVLGAERPDIPGATVRVDAHRHRCGPYSAAGSLVRAIVPSIDDAALLQRHDIEILAVAPSLEASLRLARPTLTSSARAEERTRFYPGARTRRVAHGLIDLLGEVVERSGDEWTLVVDHVDAADATDAEWLTHLLRRAHPRLHVVLTARTAELPDDLAGAVFRWAHVEIAPADAAAAVAPAGRRHAVHRVRRDRRAVACGIRRTRCRRPGCAARHPRRPPGRRWRPRARASVRSPTTAPGAAIHGAPASTRCWWRSSTAC